MKPFLRQTPVNYLVTIAAGSLLWILTGILLGNHLGDTVSLQSLTTEGFLADYRSALAAAAVAGIAACCYWYFYGSRETIVAHLPSARRRWTLLLLLQFVVAAAVLTVMVILCRAEALTTADYATIGGVVAAHTFLFYGVCTFFMSPRAVEYIPLGKH